MIGFHYQLEQLNPIFDDCPRFCANDISKFERGGGFCGDCQVKAEKDDFRFETIEALTEAAPNFEIYGFDYLYQCVIETAGNEAAEYRRTVAADAMRGIYRSELNKFRRFKEWQNKPKD